MCGSSRRFWDLRKNRPLDPGQKDTLQWLLRETFEPEQTSESSFLSGAVAFFCLFWLLRVSDLCSSLIGSGFFCTGTRPLFWSTRALEAPLVVLAPVTGKRQRPFVVRACCGVGVPRTAHSTERCDPAATARVEQSTQAWARGAKTESGNTRPMYFSHAFTDRSEDKMMRLFLVKRPKTAVNQPCCTTCVLGQPTPVPPRPTGPRPLPSWIVCAAWPEAAKQGEESSKNALLVEVGPRLSFESAVSSNAKSICRASGVDGVTRLEVRMYVREVAAHRIIETAVVVGQFLFFTSKYKRLAAAVRVCLPIASTTLLLVQGWEERTVALVCM